MYLPAIDYRTGTIHPHDQRFALDDYFNPFLNPYYRHGSGTTITEDRGCITIGYLKNILTTLTNHVDLRSLLSFLISLYLGDEYVDRLLPVYKRFYDLLPEDKKYLIFSFYCDYPLHENGREHASVTFTYLATVSDNYIIRGHLNGSLVYSQSSTYDTYTEISNSNANYPTIEAFVDALANQNAFNTFDLYHDKLFQWYDDYNPGLVRAILGYILNQKIYHGLSQNDRGINDYTPWDLFNRFSSSHSAVTFCWEEHWIRASAIVTNENRGLIERVLNYSTNVLDLLNYSIRGPKEDKATLYGVELEACSDYQPKEIIDAQKALFFILKQDGSITGSKPERYEMVTVPATLKAHKRLWAEFFEKIDYEKFDTTKDTGNGMHVHIDRKAFKSKAHLNRFIWFVTNPANYDFIYLLSERPSKNNLVQWAPFPNYDIRRSKIHNCRIATSRNSNMRGAVHLKSNKTVEVRLFKGIVSYATIVKNLEFVDSIFEYTRTSTLVQMCLGDYLAWLSATPKNRYATLKTFLQEAKAEKLIIGATLEEYLWYTDNPQEVYKKLLKAPFAVTNDHVTYLNKKKRKRTFVIKNGQLQCLVTSGGLIAKLDKTVQQKQLLSSKTFKLSAV